MRRLAAIALLASLGLAGCDLGAGGGAPSTLTVEYLVVVQDPATNAGVPGVTVQGGWNPLADAGAVPLSASGVTDASGRARLSVAKPHPGDAVVALQVAISQCPAGETTDRCAVGRTWNGSLGVVRETVSQQITLVLRGDASGGG